MSAAGPQIGGANWSEVPLAEGLKLLVRTVPDSSRTGSNNSKMLWLLAREVEEQRSPMGLFVAWIRSNIDCSNLKFCEEFESLYKNYIQFCDVKAVPSECRLTRARVGRAMSAVGIRAVRGGLRRGARLVGSDYPGARQPGAKIEEWFEACCDLTDPDAREEATPLYQAFRQFCVDRGDKEEHIVKQTTFGLRLNDAQIYSVPNHATGKKERVGIRLKREGEVSGGAAGVPPAFDDGAGELR